MPQIARGHPTPTPSLSGAVEGRLMTGRVLGTGLSIVRLTESQDLATMKREVPQGWGRDLQTALWEEVCTTLTGGEV